MHAILKSGGRSVYIYTYIYICVCGSVTLRNVNEMRSATKSVQRERRCSTQFCESTCRLSRMAEEDDEDRVRIQRLATLRKRKERERSTDEKRRRERARDADRHRHAVAECSESAAEKRERKRKSMAASRLKESPLRKSQRLSDRRECAQSTRKQGESSQSWGTGHHGP